MKKGIRLTMYGKIGTLGLTILMIIFAGLTLMRPDIGPTVVVVWCLLIVIFKLDILTLEIMKLIERERDKQGG